MQVLLIWLAVALTIGITLAVVMGRRGHSAFEWFLIGAVLGPFALPLAWGRIGSEPAAPNREIVDAAPGSGTGPIDVLVGIDGSAESETALRTAIEILGPRTGRLTLAGVTGFERQFAGSGRHEASAREPSCDGRVGERLGSRDHHPLGSTGRRADGVRSARRL